MATKEELQRQVLNLCESEINFQTYYDQIEEQILQKDKNLIKVIVALAAQMLDQNKREPIEQFLILLLIQKVVVKKSIETINEVHSSSTMLKALEKIAKHDKDNPNPNRGSSYFPTDPEIGSKFLTLILEFILKSAAQFSQDANKNPTKFAQLYGRLLDEGVTFPQEPLTFYEARKKKKNQPQSSSNAQSNQNMPSGRGNDKPPQDTQTTAGNNLKGTQNNQIAAGKILIIFRQNIEEYLIYIKAKIFDDVQVCISTLIYIFTNQDEVDSETKDGKFLRSYKIFCINRVVIPNYKLEIDRQAKIFQKYLTQLNSMLQGDGEYDEQTFGKMFAFQEFLTQFTSQVSVLQQNKYNDNSVTRFKDWLMGSELPFPIEQDQFEQEQHQDQNYQQQQQQQQQAEPKSKLQDNKKQGAGSFEENKFNSNQQPQQPQDHFDFNQFGSQPVANQGNQFNNDELFGTFTNNQMKDLQNKNQQPQPSSQGFDDFQQFGSNFQNLNKQNDEASQQSKLQQELLDQQLKKSKEQQMQLQREQEDERLRLQQAEQLRREQEDKKKKELEEKQRKQREEEERQGKEKERIRKEQEQERERIRQQQIYEEEQERMRLQKEYEDELEEENRLNKLRLQREEQERLRRLMLEEQEREEERLYREQEDRKQQDTQNDSFNQKSNAYQNTYDQNNRDSFGAQGYFYDSKLPSNVKNTPTNNINNSNSNNNNNYNISVNTISTNNINRPPAGPSQMQSKQNQDPKISKIESAFGNSNQKFSFGPEGRFNQGSQANANRNYLGGQNEDQRTEMSFNEQFSVSNISVAGGYSQHDFPMKHIKLMDNKVYKGQEVPVVNIIDRTLKQYNCNPQNVRRFKLSNMKRKNNLFENSHIQVGSISDLIFDYINSQNYLKLTIFIGNKTRLPIRNVKIEFDGEESSYVYLKQDKPIDFIPAKTQEKFEVVVGYKDVPYSLVNMDITADFGEIEESQTIETNIFLPNLLSKYIQFKDLEASVFHQKWRELRSQILKTDIFSVNKSIIKTPAYFRRFFTKILEITSLEQFVMQQNSNQYDVKYYKLGALIELADSESEFLIKFNIRPDNTLCIQIISINEAYQSTAATLLQHLRFLLQA